MTKSNEDREIHKPRSDPKVERAIRGALVDGRLSCAQAFVIAAKHGIAPLSVGEKVTRLGIKISRCQLGLFGYDDLADRRIVQPVAKVSDGLKGVIFPRLVDGKLPCKAAWEIAEQYGLSKLEVSNTAEALEIRICACQLGCFK